MISVWFVFEPNELDRGVLREFNVEFPQTTPLFRIRTRIDVIVDVES